MNGKLRNKTKTIKMLGAIIEIIIGLVLWRVVPGWITEGSQGARNFFRLAFNVVGIIVTIAGCISLITALV
jgi:hypothetical protein